MIIYSYIVLNIIFINAKEKSFLKNNLKIRIYNHLSYILINYVCKIENLI